MGDGSAQRGRLVSVARLLLLRALQRVDVARAARAHRRQPRLQTATVEDMRYIDAYTTL